MLPEEDFPLERDEHLEAVVAVRSATSFVLYCLLPAQRASYALAVVYSRTHVGCSAYRGPREEEDEDLHLELHNKVAVADVQPTDVPFGRQGGGVRSPSGQHGFLALRCSVGGLSRKRRSQ